MKREVFQQAAAANARLKISLFLHSFDPGGVERVALRLAGAWADAGCDVTVVMGRDSGPLAAEAPSGVAFEFAPPFELSRRFESIWLAPHLAAHLRRSRPDVLFCAGNTYAIVAVLVRLMLGGACPPILCKISNTLERPDFSPAMRGLYGLWLRVQALFIGGFVGLTETMRPEMIRALGVQSSRVSVIPDPALRLDDIAIGRRPRGGPRRLFVAAGRLAPQKDFALLLEAFALGRGADDRLVILGEGPERPRLERLVDALGLGGQVALPGHVKDISAWFAEADALVLSSRYEGAPAVVLEALARGLPVVATDCCTGMRELLADGMLGEVVPANDAEALARAMFAPRRRDACPTAAREHVAEFTIERAAPRYLAVLSELASSRSSSRTAPRRWLQRPGAGVRALRPAAPPAEDTGP